MRRYALPPEMGGRILYGRPPDGVPELIDLFDGPADGAGFLATVPLSRLRLVPEYREPTNQGAIVGAWQKRAGALLGAPLCLWQRLTDAGPASSETWWTYLTPVNAVWSTTIITPGTVLSWDMLTQRIWEWDTLLISCDPGKEILSR